MIKSKIGRNVWVALHLIRSMTPHCLMWHLANWQERNARTFDGCEKSAHDLKLLFPKTLSEWIDALGLFSFATLPDLLEHCTFSV